MARWVKILCAAVCSFALLFSCVGYAAVSGNLSISGSASIDMSPIYIVSVEPVSGGGELKSYTKSATLLTSTIELEGSESVVLKITVGNRTSDDYGYLATEIMASAGNNADMFFGVYTDVNCSTALTINTNTPDLPRHTDAGDGKHIFYLKINAKTAPTTATQYNTVLNFNYVIHDSLPTNGDYSSLFAANEVLEAFGSIMNNKTKRDALNTQMTEKQTANDRPSDDYIAFVPGIIDKTFTQGGIFGWGGTEVEFTDDNKCIELFGSDQLTMIVPGETEPQTIYFILKRENVDDDLTTGNADGEEFTMYITTDKLTSNATPAVVYAGVYTSNDDGATWYQLGDMLTGTSPIKQYNGRRGSGSFDTDLWRSSANYYGENSGNANVNVTTIMSYQATDISRLTPLMQDAANILNNQYSEQIYTEESLTALETMYNYINTNIYTPTKTALDNGTTPDNAQSQIVTSVREMAKVLTNLERKTS